VQCVLLNLQGVRALRQLSALVNLEAVPRYVGLLLMSALNIN
jgi:hypothetical protein